MIVTGGEDKDEKILRKHTTPSTPSGDASLTPRSFQGESSSLNEDVFHVLFSD